MPLETASTIDQLVAANPAANDAASTAASHLRLIKAALKATFPNLTGALQSTAAQIDANIASPARLAALEAGKVSNSGSQTINGGLTVTTAINTGQVLQQGSTLVPQGVIVMWNNPASIPPGWALCDGQGGRPNLQDRMVIGSGPGRANWTGSNGVQSAPAGAGTVPAVVLCFIIKL